MTVPLVAAIPIPQRPHGKAPHLAGAEARRERRRRATTTPAGNKLTDESTSVVESSVTSPAPGADERTQHATDLPAAAKENPFDGQPGTVQASDLPAAAASVPGAPPRRQSGKHPRARARAFLPAAVGPARHRCRAGADHCCGHARFPKRGRARHHCAPWRAGLHHRASRRRDHDHAEADPEQSLEDVALCARRTDQTADAATVLSHARHDAVLHRPHPLLGVRVRRVESTFKAPSARSAVAVNLVPVMVAAENLSEGSVLTEELGSTREVPDQFVTAPSSSPTPRSSS